MRSEWQAAWILVAGFAIAANAQNQPAKQYQYATDLEVQSCAATGSDLVQQICDSLAREFDRDKRAETLKLMPDGTPNFATGLPLELRDPTVVLGAFIKGERKMAFADLAANRLKGEAKATAEFALSSLSQMLSTKAAVNQGGANSSAAGSTTLASKPTTTDFISIAAESGAFTDTLNGNSMTAQVNANGLRRYLSNKPFSGLDPQAEDALEHLNLAATFSVAQSGSTGIATTGSATATTPSIASIILPSNNISFSSVSVNYSLVRPFRPNSKKFVDAWKDAEQKNAQAIANANSDIYQATAKLNPAMEAAESDKDVIAALFTWEIGAQQDEKRGDFKQFVQDYKTYTDTFFASLKKADANIDAEILAIDTGIGALEGLNSRMLDQARGTLCTISYSYSTPQNKPATHSTTLATAYVFKNRSQLTANAAGTWFASIPAGAKYGRVQSYQFSGEFDKPIGGKPEAPKATLSVAGYGQFQYDATVLNITAGNLAPGTNIPLTGDAQVLLGTPGWLGVAQTKLAFNIGKGLTIPVAVKWSNKTDLLTANNWKGQFGLSYDLTALSSLLSGMNK